MLKIKKGDEIIITVGKDRGKKGKVEKVMIKDHKVLIPGLNIYKKHMKKRDEKNPGGIIEFSRPIADANVSVICPKCGKPTRMGFLLKNDKKVGICRKCDSII